LNTNVNVAAGETLDLREMVRLMWRRRWWLIAVMFVAAALAAAYALSSERVYRATTLFAPAESDGGGAQAANTEEALAVLRSRDFTLRFFEDEKILRKLFAEAWDEEQQRWKTGIKAPSISRAYVYFDSEIRTIVQNKKTGLVSLQVEWTDRVEAAHWANELIRRLNAEMRARAIDDANESIKYLERELASTAVVEVRDALNRLIEAQIKERMLANVNDEYAFRVIDRAAVPELDEPVRPHRRKIVMIGAILGFLLAASGIVLFDYFTRKN
jgi:uncharacterized protein involved in exopolysaccharide biosynthesis